MSKNTESSILNKSKDTCSTSICSNKREQSELAKLATYLAWFTIFYNLIEGIVSIWLGLESDAIALAGFGGDSLIEVGSAMVVLWRLGYEKDGKDSQILSAERRATMVIGALFVLLAMVASASSILFLFQKNHPETTIPGAIISGISISFMFFLWRAKLKVARGLDSKTLAQDAACSLACIKLSVVLFMGSLMFWIQPALWWADSIAALILSYFILMEGVEAIRAARSPNFEGGCGCS